MKYCYLLFFLGITSSLIGIEASSNSDIIDAICDVIDLIISIFNLVCIIVQLVEQFGIIYTVLGLVICILFCIFLEMVNIRLPQSVRRGINYSLFVENVRWLNSK